MNFRKIWHKTGIIKSRRFVDTLWGVSCEVEGEISSMPGKIYTQKYTPKGIIEPLEEGYGLKTDVNGNIKPTKTKRGVFYPVVKVITGNGSNMTQGIGFKKIRVSDKTNILGVYRSD